MGSMVSFWKNLLPKTSGLRVIREGRADRVHFLGFGEDGTYVDQCWVKLYDNGIVEFESRSETTTVHLQNVEIIWRLTDMESNRSKIRILEPPSPTLT